MSKKLKEWYLGLPQKDAQPMQKEIMTRCFISRSVFYNWINGVTKVPEVCKPIINEIAGKDVFEN